jgi:c-di-GMP-binding flagellar brake protein YcgR
MGVDLEAPKDKIKLMDTVKVAFRIPTKENQKKHEWAIVSAKAEIRFIGDGEQKKTRLGLQFTEILEDDRRNIREYWLMRQREELKRKLEYES